MSPIIKYSRPESVGLAPIQREKISVIAVKMPPRAWPLDIAVIYFGEKRPTIPIKLPPKIALTATKKSLVTAQLLQYLMIFQILCIRYHLQLLLWSE